MAVLVRDGLAAAWGRMEAHPDSDFWDVNVRAVRAAREINTAKDDVT